MSGVIITRLPKVGEVWMSKHDATIKLTVTDVYVEESDPRAALNDNRSQVWFDQELQPGERENYVDRLGEFVKNATAPAETEEQTIEVVESGSKTEGQKLEELLAAMTPAENDAASRAARTATALHEMLRITKPTTFEAVTCCVSLLLEVIETVGLDVDDACKLIKGTHTRLAQYRAEQAAQVERASEAS